MLNSQYRSDFNNRDGALNCQMFVRRKQQASVGLCDDRLLQGALDTRNGLCHGLVGISAEVAQVAPAFRWEPNGEKNSIS